MVGFRRETLLVFLIVLSGHVSISTPIHPAIKRKLPVTASMTQPSPQIQDAQSTIMPTEVLNENIPGQQSAKRIPPLPTPFTYTGSLTVSSQQTKIQTSQSIQSLRDQGNEKRQLEKQNTDRGIDKKRKFSCDYPECKYTATKHSNLKAHKITHVGEKPFSCDYPECGFSSARNNNLKTHKMKHTKEKPYHCDSSGCNYASSRKANLVRHIRMHNEEKPFQCDRLGCCYVSSCVSNLKRHKQTHNR